MDKIDIDKNSGVNDECYTDWFKCTNPKCCCTDIQSHHRFCPMCGLAINWIEGSAPKETKSVVIRKSSYYITEKTGKTKWYICPNCDDKCIEYPEEKCTNCGSTIEWEDDE